MASCEGRLLVDWPDPGAFEPTMVLRRDGQVSFVPSVPCGERLCFGGELSDSTLELRFDVREASEGLNLLLEAATWGSLPEVELALRGRHHPSAVVVWQEAGSHQDALPLDLHGPLRLAPGPEDRLGLLFDDRLPTRRVRVRPPTLDDRPPDATLVATEDQRLRRFSGEYRDGRRDGIWTWHNPLVPAVREVIFDDGVLVAMGDWSYGAWRTVQGAEVAHPDLVDCPEGSLLEGEVDGGRVDQWCRWTEAQGEVLGGPRTTWHLSGERRSQRTLVAGAVHGLYTHWTDGFVSRIGRFDHGEPAGQELGFEQGVLRRRVVHGTPLPGRDSTWWYPSGRRSQLNQAVAGMGNNLRTLRWYPTGVLHEHCEPLSVDERWCWSYRPDGTLEDSGPIVHNKPIAPTGRTPPAIANRPVVLPEVLEVPMDQVPATVLEASANTRAVGATGAKPAWVYVADLDRDGQADWLVRYANAFATVLLGGGTELVHAGEVMRVVDLHVRHDPDASMSAICGMAGAGPDAVLYVCHDFARGEYDFYGYPAGLADPEPWTASCTSFGDCQLLLHLGGTVWRSDDPWTDALVDCPAGEPCTLADGGHAHGELLCSVDGDRLACVLTHPVHLHLQRGWLFDLESGERRELALPSREGPAGELVRVVGAPRWSDGELELLIDELGELRPERRDTIDWLVRPR